MANILHKKNKIAGSFANRGSASFTPTGEAIPETTEPGKTPIDFFEITEVDGDVAKLEAVTEITDAPRFAGKTLEVPGPPKYHRDRRQKFSTPEKASHSTPRTPRQKAVAKTSDLPPGLKKKKTKLMGQPEAGGAVNDKTGTKIPKNKKK